MVLIPLAMVWLQHGEGAPFWFLAGALMLGEAIARMTGSWVLAVLAVPGGCYLIAGQGLSNMVIWAFQDRMEGGLAFAIGGPWRRRWRAARGLGCWAR